jgi:hypothetical protein
MCVIQKKKEKASGAQFSEKQFAIEDGRPLLNLSDLPLTRAKTECKKHH